MRRLGQLLVALLVGAGMATVAVLALQARQEAARERDARVAAEAEAAELQAAAARAERVAAAAADSAAAATARALEATVQARLAAADAARAARAALTPPEPVAGDSVRFWRESTALLVEENTELRSALRISDSLVAVQEGRIASLTREVQASHAREDSTAAAFARFRAGVEATLAAREKACTVPGTFGQIACPSRTTAAVGGVALALLGVHVVDRLTDDHRDR